VPPLLLLDEPITDLDLASQERILEVLEEETTRDVTVVLSTHHLDEARHCDRVLLLAGRLVADGSPDEVLRPDLLRGHSVRGSSETTHHMITPRDCYCSMSTVMESMAEFSDLYAFPSSPNRPEWYTAPGHP